MKCVPIVSKEWLRQAASISPFELPLLHMNDFSRTGSQVPPYEDALEDLKHSCCEVSENAASADLSIEEEEDIPTPTVVRMLTDLCIDCHMGDVAIALYQG